MSKFKPILSISNIGKKQFYFGLIIGLGYSITLNYLLRLTTMFANFTFSSQNPYFLNYENYNFSPFIINLIGISSVCFGFTYTTYIWLSKICLKNRKLRIRNRFGQANSIFIFYVCLLFLVRLLNFFIHNPIYLERDFKISSYLLPTFVFLYNWNSINKIFKAQKFLVIIILIILILGKIITLI